MKRLILVLIILLGCLKANSQILQPQCNNPLGIVTASSTGSFFCNVLPLNPPISSIFDPPPPETRCFSYQYFAPITLSYLLVTGLCGPFPLYNDLSFTIYNSTCDTLVASGTIVPTPSNTLVNGLVPGQWYKICYTWVPNCPQTAACPLIYSSALPVELIYFDGEYDAETGCTVLSWITASEKNASHFIVEESYDLVEFKNPMQIMANGTTSAANEYTALDCSPNTAVTYYRLTQYDFDGKSEIVGLIAIATDDFDSGDIEIYDVVGRKINQLNTGVNIVKKDGRVYKVIKIVE